MYLLICAYLYVLTHTYDAAPSLSRLQSTGLHIRMMTTYTCIYTYQIYQKGRHSGGAEDSTTDHCTRGGGAVRPDRHLPTDQAVFG